VHASCSRRLIPRGRRKTSEKERERERSQGRGFKSTRPSAPAESLSLSPSLSGASVAATVIGAARNHRTRVDSGRIRADRSSMSRKKRWLSQNRSRDNRHRYRPTIRPLISARYAYSRCRNRYCQRRWQGSARRAEYYFDPRLVIANYRRASAEE